ncbi:MAG: thiaminase II [Candidatus Dormibacteraeota bacterium]|uniref:Aminopyrimidine aminohydrolase n=2 Tax=Candidatus Dormibacteraceae TaxID=3126998 RepID=A0A934K778_9BACT|nr:thiaminase II [Candidatus Dormibacteraeota bacterium]MBJ7603489.1 thiaminase II [Candidatus Dormibacteraeota bacterium]PZS28687.1 MAG: thiaminase II [Pseudonocardiales bacterium]
MGFSEELRAAADPIWQAQHDHPFVRGIGDGTVDVERFKRWVRQDYLFLVEYCRLLALAAGRSPDLATLRRFAELLQATAVTEMDLHRSYAAQFGIRAEEMEAEEMAPVTRSYTNFLLRTAAIGDFAELAAALLPCIWGFNEIGIRLADHGRPHDPRCVQWIDAYAHPEFTRLAVWCRQLVDDLAVDAGPTQQGRMRQAFLVSSRYELGFWDV